MASAILSLVSDSDHDIFDPVMFRIVRGTHVWVARPNVNPAGPLRLFFHRMKHDMKFRGLPETLTNLAPPGPGASRLLIDPLNRESDRRTQYIFGWNLRFCTFVDHGQNRVGKQIVGLGLDPADFTADELAREGYSTFWTGKKRFPFIVCATDLYRLVHEEEKTNLQDMICDGSRLMP